MFFKSFIIIFLFQERTVNIIVGLITSLMVFITLISAFIFDEKANRGLNITFAVIIIMICLSHLLLVSVVY
jgi:hypothetical protein